MNILLAGSGGTPLRPALKGWARTEMGQNDTRGLSAFLLFFEDISWYGQVNIWEDAGRHEFDSVWGDTRLGSMVAGKSG